MGHNGVLLLLLSREGRACEDMGWVVEGARGAGELLGTADPADRGAGHGDQCGQK